MKVTVPIKTLRHVAAAIAAFYQRSPLPGWPLRIEANGSSITMSAQCLAGYLAATVPCHVGTGGSATVDMRHMNTAIKAFQEDVTIHGASQSITVRSGGRAVRIPKLTSEVIAPDLRSPIWTGTLTRADLKAITTAVLTIQRPSEENTQYVTDVWINIAGDKLSTFSTDSHRLGVSSLQVQPEPSSEEQVSFSIPKSAFRVLSVLLPVSEDTIQMKVYKIANGGYLLLFGITAGDGSTVSVALTASSDEGWQKLRKGVEKYLNYPAENVVSATIASSAFQQALRQVVAVTTRSRVVMLHLGKPSLIASFDENLSIAEQLQVQSDQEITLCFNAGYLLDAVKYCTDEEIVLSSVKGANTPLLFSNSSSPKEVRYLTAAAHAPALVSRLDEAKQLLLGGPVEVLDESAEHIELVSSLESDEAEHKPGDAEVAVCAED